MIVVICSTYQLRGQVEEILTETGEEVTAFASCAEIDSIARGRERACVYVTQILTTDAVKELQQIQLENLCPPTVLVTRNTSERYINVGGLQIHAVVALDNLAKLPFIVNDVLAECSVAEQFVRVIQADVPLPRWILRALVNRTIRSDKRVPNRGKVAESAGCKVHRLDAELTKAFDGRPHVWGTWRYVARTLRAYDLSHRRVTTSEGVAKALGTNRKTMCRGYAHLGIESFRTLCKLSPSEALTRALTALGLRETTNHATQPRNSQLRPPPVQPAPDKVLSSLTDDSNSPEPRRNQPRKRGPSPRPSCA